MDTDRLDPDLTTEEQRAIARLQRLAKRWPKTLWLYSAPPYRACVDSAGACRRRESETTEMNAIKFLALCIVPGCSIATWATCEPPPREESPYKPLPIKRPAEYRPLVSMTGSRP